MFIDVTAPVPINFQSFQTFISSFVFFCPSARVIGKKKDKSKRFVATSVRDCTFRERGITGTLLTTMTAQIKRLVDFYKKVEKNQNIEEIFESSTNNEKIVFRENAQMSDSEVVFYYIRNAFAHGAFEYIPNKKMYKLESKKDGRIRARMILSETTLKKLSELSSLDKKSVERLQRKRKK